MDDEVIPDSSSECAIPPNTVLLCALKKKFDDTTVPSFSGQIPSHPSEPQRGNWEHDSDSSDTYFSEFETGMCHDSSGQHKACDTLLMETGTQEMNGDPIISIIMDVNDGLVRADDEKNSFSSSPVIQDLSADWSHLINLVINDDEINNTLLTAADTVNNYDISVSTNNEAVTSTVFTTEDTVSNCNTQIPHGMVHPHSTAFETDSFAMSADMFASLSFDTDHKDCTSKNSSYEYEQDASMSNNIQPTTDYETVVTGKSHFQTLYDASTDRPCDSSPDKMESETVVKNITKDKKTVRKSLRNKPDVRKLKFQVLHSATVEREGPNSQSNSNKFRSSEGFHAKEVASDSTAAQGAFPKVGKFTNGTQKKIPKQGKCQSKRKSSQENIHRSRKEKLYGGKTYQNYEHAEPPTTRMKTGSLPSVSATFTHSKTAPRRSYSLHEMHRIRDQMSEIQQEVRGWLRGWGPPLNKARAHELIAEVQGMLKNIISSSESNPCSSLKNHAVQEINQVSEKLLFQLQSALTDPELEEQMVTDRSLEGNGCCCCTEDLGTETDTSNEMCSQRSDDSDIEQSQDSSVALQMIQEMTIADDKTVGGNSITKSPEICNINNSACYDVPTDSDTCWKHTNGSLQHGRTHKGLAGSLDKMKQSNTKKFGMAVKQVHFAPTAQDPPLQSTAHAEHLMEVSHVVESQTHTQSTYFSNHTNLQATYSTQTQNLSHTPIYTKLTDGSSNKQIQMQTNAKSTADTQQSEIQLNVHSELNSQQNIQSRTLTNESTNEISSIQNCSSSLKKRTCDLPHPTGTRQKQITNSSGSSGEKVIRKVQSSMGPPDEKCCLPSENPLKMSSTTEGHDDRNGKQMESSRPTENPAEIIVSKQNNKTGTEKSQSSVDIKTINKADSRITVMSSNRSQTQQNVSKSSVTGTNAKQTESFQSLSILQDSTAESQYSDQFGLTLSMMTQPEEGSFIFGIKKIWLHSASEYVPNHELPEDFWMNKTTPFPKDLLQALDNY